LGDGVIVGHHIDHDISTFDAAYERHWGFRMSNRSLDTMDLTLHLERDGAFAGRPAIRRFTLDALCDLFGVIPTIGIRRAAMLSSPRRCSSAFFGCRRGTDARRLAA
jgi:DNA polymerase III alpha subunit (gram-positive type)